jgi:hypothetical protein
VLAEQTVDGRCRLVAQDAAPSAEAPDRCA